MHNQFVNYFGVLHRKRDNYSRNLRYCVVFPSTRRTECLSRIYPDRNYYHYDRIWLCTGNDNTHVILLNSANRTSWLEKYSEVKTEKGYKLTIKDTTILDEGRYAVQCLDFVYSYSYILNVTKAESAITVPHTQRNSDNEIERNSPFRTSKSPSTTTVNSARTDRHEASTISSTHRSSTDEGDKDSVTRFVSSRQPSTTEVNIDITNMNEEDYKESTKQITNLNTTKKEKEKTSASTEEEGINIEELKLLIPITVSVVSIVIAVAIVTVCLTVRKKRNNETQLKRPEVASDDNEDTDGRLHEDVRGLMLSSDVVQEQAIPSCSEARSDVLAQACEPPEYASVIPKEKRVCEAKQNINKTKTSLICDNTETENLLVYAELDLQPVSNIRPTTSRYEATEYVSVDFSKTRTSQANTIPDQQDTTEYVSVDFSKRGTPQGNTVLPEQTDTTEHVSVDFSKTAELQTEDQGDGK